MKENILIYFRILSYLSLRFFQERSAKEQLWQHILWEGRGKNKRAKSILFSAHQNYCFKLCFSHLSHKSNGRAVVFEIYFFCSPRRLTQFSHLLTCCSDKIFPSFSIYFTNVIVEEERKITHSFTPSIVFSILCSFPVLIYINTYSDIPVSNHS